MKIPQHDLRTWRTADQVEALSEPTMTFRMDSSEAEQEKYAAGDYVIITSADGAIFLGTIEDVEPDDLKLYVALT
ncbi:MAG: hypothetical protein NVS3B1_17690 [Marmoricola sp.]